MQLRMHLLLRMRAGDGSRLPELRRRTGSTAPSSAREGCRFCLKWARYETEGFRRPHVARRVVGRRFSVHPRRRAGPGTVLARGVARWPRHGRAGALLARCGAHPQDPEQVEAVPGARILQLGLTLLA